MNAISIEALIAAYPDVPRSVVLRFELNRVGVAMSPDALRAVRDMDLCFKGEFMFSWDAGERKKLVHKVPQCFWLKRDDTIFQHRTNDSSPYAIDYLDDRFFLTDRNNDGQPFEKIYFKPAPDYYKMKTSDGIPMSQVTQSIGDKLFTAINKYCEYFKDGLQCKFCDLTPTGVEQARSGEALQLHRTAEQIAETLEAALSESGPRSYRHMTFSGGTIITAYRGEADLDYYVDLLNTVYKRLKRWYPCHIQIAPPQDKDGWKRLLDTGITCVQPNLEVMDRRLFEIICPGKAKYVGYDEWIRRLLEGVEVFGAGRIVPNFVIGCEMAKPFGFQDIDEAVASNLKGFEFLMQNGVFPRTAVWLVTERSVFADQQVPPLEYYIKLARGYKELCDKYGFHDWLTACRGCHVQDALYDWSYAEREKGLKQQVVSPR